MGGSSTPSTPWTIRTTWNNESSAATLVQLFFVKPTTPATTVGIIIGNADGKPGHKRNLTINIAITPDDDLPRRSRQIGPNYS